MPDNDRTSEASFQTRYGVLLDIGRVLTGTLDPAELYRTIYEQASRVLETTGFYISLYDAEADEATVVFFADRGDIARPGVTYRGSDSRAIRDKEPVHEELTRPDQGIMILGPETDEEVTRSVIAAPMLHEGRVLGVISAQSYRRDAYTELDTELLAAVAGLAAAAVANARSMEELERQRRESERLEQVGRALTASLELDAVLQRIASAALDLVEADGAGVWLVRGDGRAEIAITAGELALPVGTTIRVTDALYRRFLNERRPVVVEAGSADPLLPPELMEVLQAGSAIAVPLVAEDDLVGALSVSHAAPRHYTEHDIRLLKRFAVNAAVAVSNARLHEQVRMLSLTDPLTELPNRRHMQIVLEKEFAAAERGRSLALVMFDLDDFKMYNDVAGHQAGDEVLRRFARILVEETRAMNLAARYGGDEFICILSDTDEEGGAIHAGRVMRAVRADDLLADMGVSAGIACYHAGMRSHEELIWKADQELYRAKSSRHDRQTTSS
jgi:diguanylate cyclase (GGDEF)-like protein